MMDIELGRGLEDMAVELWRQGMDPDACHFATGSLAASGVLLIGGYEIPVFVDAELPEGVWYLLPGISP